MTKGVRPDRPESPIMDEQILKLVQRCWKPIPSERPRMEDIVAALTLAA